MGEIKGQFVFPMDKLQSLIDRRVKESHKSVEGALGYQMYRLAGKLHELWNDIVKPARIRNEMMTSVESGKGYKRTAKKYKGSAVKKAMADNPRNMVVAALAQTGTGLRNWKNFLRRNIGALPIEAQNRIKQNSRYDFKRARNGEIQRIMFEAELKRRVGKIGYQASGWLPGVWRFSNRANAGTRQVKFRQGSESWADASGRKRVAKTAPGRVLERWLGVHRYEVALVNFAHGIEETASRYGLVDKAVEARRADILAHLKDAAQDGMTGGN